MQWESPFHRKQSVTVGGRGGMHISPCLWLDPKPPNHSGDGVFSPLTWASAKHLLRRCDTLSQQVKVLSSSRIQKARRKWEVASTLAEEVFQAVKAFGKTARIGLNCWCRIRPPNKTGSLEIAVVCLAHCPPLSIFYKSIHLSA